jgi:hypothetical protein
MQNDFNNILQDLIARYPGCTAKEYAKMLIDQGLCDNGSWNTLFSLQTMLIKEYRDGRMPQIKVVKVDRKTRYFPAYNLKSAMRTYFRLAAQREAANFNRQKPHLPRHKQATNAFLFE